MKQYTKFMNIILFTPKDNQFFSANDVRYKHICTILHKKIGDTFYAGIENDVEGLATITSITNKGLFFDFTPNSTKSLLFPIELLIGFPRPIQLKRLFRDVASLGAKTIHLTGTDLGEKSYMNSKMVERGTALQALRDGTIQAKSTYIPNLQIHNSVDDYIKKNMVQQKSLNRLICLDPVRAATSLSCFLDSKKYAKDSNIVVAIGAERGWTDRERNLMQKAGFTFCSIGKRILRTETATTVALALTLQHMEIL